MRDLKEGPVFDAPTEQDMSFPCWITEENGTGIFSLLTGLNFGNAPVRPTELPPARKVAAPRASRYSPRHERARRDRRVWR